MRNALISVSGLLHLLTFIFSLISWACVVSVKGYGSVSNLVYAVVVLIIWWFLDFCYLIVFGIGLHERINLREKQWGALDFFISALGSCLIFAAAICIAVSCGNISTLQAGSAFAFFTSFVMAGTAISAWKKWVGYLWCCPDKSERSADVVNGPNFGPGPSAPGPAQNNFYSEPAM